MLFRLLGMLIIPVMLFAQEHRVPIATQGNKLILNVQNTLSADLQNVRVTVQSAPTWLEFGKAELILQTVAGAGIAEALFEFKVLNTEPELSETVTFVISNEDGALIGRRFLKFRTFSLPKDTKLSSAYPNPANPTTTVSYELNRPSQVKIEVFNILGQRVKQLFEATKPAGVFSITWDGTNISGRQVASGNYIIRMITRGEESNKVKHYDTKVVIQK